MIYRTEYTSKKDEELYFEWIDKVIEFFPEFEKDIFKNIMLNINCSNESIIKNVGERMLKLEIIEKTGGGMIEYSNFGRQIKRHGNLTEFLTTQKKKEELIKIREERELENLEYSIKLNKWLIKSKWLPHLISIISLIIAIFAFLKE